MKTHKCTNSEAQNLYIVRAQERIHWLLGYRQAELELDGIEQAIGQEEELRQIDFLKKEIYPSLAFWKPAIALLKILQIQLKSDWLRPFQRSRHDPDRLRDAEWAKQTFTAEKERIEQEHPEILSMDFRQIQSLTQEAFICARAFHIHARKMAAEFGLPDSVGELLANSEPRHVPLILQEVGRFELEIGMEIAPSEFGSTSAIHSANRHTLNSGV